MFKRAPILWNLDALVEYAIKKESTVKLTDGRYVPARPYGFFSIKERVRLAWLVFTGKADAVKWPGDQ
jgi:hypothetical protein